MQHGAIAEHAHLGLGVIVVAQVYHIVHYIFEIGVQCGFAIARKSDYIERVAGLLHLSQAVAQGALHALASRHSGGALSLGIKSRLAIEAIERTYLAIVRHQVHAKRHAQAAAVYGTEYCLVK